MAAWFAFGAGTPRRGCSDCAASIANGMINHAAAIHAATKAPRHGVRNLRRLYIKKALQISRMLKIAIDYL
jgi:hypothetical protein